MLREDANLSKTQSWGQKKLIAAYRTALDDGRIQRLQGQSLARSFATTWQACGLAPPQIIPCPYQGQGLKLKGVEPQKYEWYECCNAQLWVLPLRRLRRPGPIPFRWFIRNSSGPWNSRPRPGAGAPLGRGLSVRISVLQRPCHGTQTWELGIVFFSICLYYKIIMKQIKPLENSKSLLTWKFLRFGLPMKPPWTIPQDVDRASSLKQIKTGDVELPELTHFLAFPVLGGYHKYIYIYMVDIWYSHSWYIYILFIYIYIYTKHI